MLKRTCAVVLVVALAAGEAAAFLNSGTLLTNAATATYTAGGAGGGVTFSAMMRVLVANPALFAWKSCTPSVVSSMGGLVTCTLCFSNGGANTAFNVTLNDKLPNGSGMWWRGYAAVTDPGGCAPVGTTGFWVGAGASKWDSYSMNGGASWTAGAPATGQQAPAGGLMLRWRVNSLGIGVSGAITFLMSVG